MDQETEQTVSPLTSRVLVVCGRAPEIALADPDRCWRLAEGLAASNDVILAVPALTSLSHERFAVVYYNRRNVAMIARDSDVAVCDAAAATEQPSLPDAGKPLAVDLAGLRAPADPAGTTGSADAGGESSRVIAPDDPDSDVMRILGSADFFICPTEAERRGWLEALKQAGRVNEFTLDGDSGLRGLIDVVRPGDRMQPLVSYCAAPRFARDRGTGYSRVSLPVEPKYPGGLAHKWRRLRYLMGAGGLRAVWAHGAAAIKRRIPGGKQNR